MATVLIVDDDREVRGKYKRLLKENDFKVIEATNALDVAEVLMRSQSDIDLILLDIQLPEIDGRGIYEVITDYTQSIPIMVFSVIPIAEQKMRIARARDYFQKSDADRVLLRKIKGILGTQSVVS